ncbi:MAG: flagellar export protein FliJ [Alphaproteobacteria bacterium]
MAADLKALIRYSKWGVDEKRRVLADLQRREDAILAEQRALEEEILAEQRLVATSAVEVSAGFAYGGFAIRCLQRREQLSAALENARALVAQAQDELAEAFRELKTYEISQANRERREREEMERREQVDQDEISLNLFRRGRIEEGGEAG